MFLEGSWNVPGRGQDRLSHDSSSQVRTGHVRTLHSKLACLILLDFRSLKGVYWVS